MKEYGLREERLGVAQPLSAPHAILILGIHEYIIQKYLDKVVVEIIISTVVNRTAAVALFICLDPVPHIYSQSFKSPSLLYFHSLIIFGFQKEEDQIQRYAITSQQSY